MCFNWMRLLCLIVVTVCAEKEVEIVQNNQDRLFLLSSGSVSFTTFTLLKTTTTITSTFTSSTTCTTSSTTLTTCTIGRRRRGLFYDEAMTQGRNQRGLFYTDDEDVKNEGSTFLFPEKKFLDVDEVTNRKPVDTFSIIPLTIESGFTVPAEMESHRLLLAFGTSTVTSLTITYTTISLTAFCSSTTGFALCGSLGK